MKDSIPFHFPKSTYHESKKQLDAVLDELGIEWDSEKKVWAGEHGIINGVFKGFKKPAVLHVSGDDTLINAFKKFADEVGAEIKDVEIEDIKETRKAEKAERDEKRKRDEIIRLKKEKDKAEAFESVIRVKIDGMRLAEMSDVGIRNWIFMELGVDISERFGLEKIEVETHESGLTKTDDKQQAFCDADDDDEKIEAEKPVRLDVETKPKKSVTEKNKPVDKKEEKSGEGFISFVCRAGNHKACGGQTCTCSCHNK